MFSCLPRSATAQEGHEDDDAADGDQNDLWSLVLSAGIVVDLCQGLRVVATARIQRRGHRQEPLQVVVVHGDEGVDAISQGDEAAELRDISFWANIYSLHNLRSALTKTRRLVKKTRYLRMAPPHPRMLTMMTTLLVGRNWCHDWMLRLCHSNFITAVASFSSPRPRTDNGKSLMMLGKVTKTLLDHCELATLVTPEPTSTCED